MRAKIIFTLLITGIYIAPFQAKAICVKNRTQFLLYYEIENRNSGYPAPKEKFHSGFVNGGEKKCHGHIDEPGDEWKIYRFDMVRISKVDEYGERTRVCNKLVEGIINKLEIWYFKLDDTLRCLDDDDFDD